MAVVRSEGFKALLAAPAGERFLRHYQNAQQTDHRPLWLRPRTWAGGGLVLLGVCLWPVPFPTFPVTLTGLCLLASQSEHMARWLDQSELRSRRWFKRSG